MTVINSGDVLPPGCSRTARRSSAKAAGGRALTFESDRILIKHGTDVQAAEGRRRPGARGRASSESRPRRPRLAIGASGRGGRHRRAAASDCCRDDRARCARARRASTWCSRRALVAVVAMEWALAHPRLLDRVRRREQRRAPRRCCTRSPASGPRSRARSCCGCCSSAATSRSSRTSSATAPTDPLVAWALARRARRRAVLLRADARAGEPVPDWSRAPCRSTGSGPNPLLQNHPLMAFHPPMLYLGYVGLHRAVLVRDRRARHRPLRRGLARRHPPRDARRVGLPHRRHRPRRVVELRGARVGRLLGVGPGRERVAAAVAHRDRVHPLGDGAGAARDAARLEPVARDRDVLPHDPRHVPHPLRRRQLGPRVHAVDDRPVAARRSSAIVAVTGIGLIAWRGDALRAPGRIDSPVSRESAFLANNLLFAGLAFVVLLGTVFPLLAEALQGKQLSVGEPYFDRMTHADRPRAAVPDGGGAGAAVAARRAARCCATGCSSPRGSASLTMVVAVVLGAARARRRCSRFGLGAFAVAGDRAPVRASASAAAGGPTARGVAAGARCARCGGNPRLLRRPRRPRRRGAASRSSRRASSAYSAPSARCGSRRASRRPSRGYTRHVPRLAHRRAVGQKNTVSADVRVERGGDDLGSYAPAISTFPNASRASARRRCTPACVDDVYLTLVSSPNDAGPGHARRPDQPDDAVAVDRRAAHGARHGRRAAAAAEAHRRGAPTGPGRDHGARRRRRPAQRRRARARCGCGGRARPYEAPVPLDRARCRCGGRRASR